ncbi:MAG: DUF1501 domain-containing protein [Planctomycetes bacterium]|nr:DUF1501 domain-containing protein [Planctomycetota bacterium]
MPSTRLARRQFLSGCGLGLGNLALHRLLGDPLAPKAPHFRPRARRIVQLFMGGAPSQFELFADKPALTRLEGKPIPPSVIGGQRYAFIRPDAAVLGPRFAFARHGRSGIAVSEALPHLAKIVDRLCFVHSLHTDQFNHGPAQVLLQTGSPQPGRPALGSWALYGLGTETRDLPAFVVMSTGSGLSGGSALWSNGFLPAQFAGVRLRDQGPLILDLERPRGIDERLQRDSLDTIVALDALRAGRDHDPELQARIAAYEMAFRLQVSAPELTDLSQESPATLQLYGCEPQQPSFARACLLTRRLLERGVRCVTIFHEGWDAHSDVAGNVRTQAAMTDQASAALVLDLERRGLLDDTLVVWGGEFGRTPMVETNPALGRSLGRDHHPQAFSMWLAGGGIRAGHQHGATDDLGFHVVQDPVHVHDLQATILHCLGFDHERLTWRHAGRDYRLTDVHGKVVHGLLA